jgi:iron complex outermembrane recepter protein
VKTERRSKWMLAVSALGIILSNPGVAFADEQAATSTNNATAEQVDATTPPTDDTRSSEIVVTGPIRTSLGNAAAEKRASDVIQDGISAEDIGNIPDLDLGEALVRIPGVQIDRDAERRGSSISVRGLPASFTKTTVMGQNIASPSAARFRVNPFGAFDSSIFSGANVIKSFTPDIQSGGLGANVDLRIAPALSRKDGQFVLRAELGYEETPEAANPGLFASFSKHFGGGTFGVFATAAYSKLKFRRDISTINAYQNLVAAPTAANPSGRFLAPTNLPLQAQLQALDPDLNTPNDYSVLIPTQFRQFTEQSDGDRLSAAGGFEWQPTDGLSIRTDVIFTKRNLDDNLLDTIEFNIEGANTTRTPVGQAIDAGSFNSIPELVSGVDNGELERVFYFPQVSFSNPVVSPGNRSFNFFEQTYAIYPQIEYKDDDWNIRAVGTYSKAKNEFVQEQFQVNALAGAGALNNGITGSLNTGNGDIRDYALSLNIPTTAFVFTGLPTTTLPGNGTTATFNGGRNNFRLLANNQRVARSLYSGELSVERFLNLGPITSVKIGGRYQRDDALNLRQNNSLFGARVENLTSNIFQLNTSVTSGGTFFGGQAPGYLRNNFLSLNLDAVRAALLPLDPARIPAGVPQNFLSPWSRTSPLTDQAANNWKSDRKNFEAFAMAKFNLLEATGIAARGNFGVRYTDTKLSGNVLAVTDSTGATVLAEAPTSSTRFNKWLPSTNLIVDLTNNLVLNAAYYHTFEALDLTEFSPAPSSYSALNNDADADVDRLTITVSSLDRRPRSSKAIDLGLTWYNRTGSLIGFNLFQKNISSQYNQIAVCPASVAAALPTAVAFDGLTIDASNVCRTSANATVLLSNVPSTLPAGSEIIVNQFVPSNNKLKIKGIEAQIQQDLSFLDGWISGFGFQANMSYIDTNIKVFGVSKYTYNLIAYYENEDFAIRLARNTRAKNFLPAGGGFQGGERQVKGRSQLDASLRVTPFEGLDLRLEAFNITNVRREEYEFVPGLARRTDYDGRTYSLSAQVKF